MTTKSVCNTVEAVKKWIICYRQSANVLTSLIPNTACAQQLQLREPYTIVLVLISSMAHNN